MVSVLVNFEVTYLTNLLTIISFYFILTAYGSAPISDFEDATIPTWYPYNLIETDPSCYKIGPPYCPMFPKGGPLSVFPNSEEKFQHALHNMHRMHYSPNSTGDIENVDITKWWGGAWSRDTYTNYYTGGDYCGVTSTRRKPLYWYSDANAAARFEAWDFDTCNVSLSSRHNTCNDANGEVIWSKDGNISIPTNRCDLFKDLSSDSCSYSARRDALTVEKNETKGETPLFFWESICTGNSCFKDTHCDPIFASVNDYVGNGFVEGMNGVTSLYSKDTYEIQYELPIGAHYDDRLKTKPVDRDGTGKYFTFILQYWDNNGFAPSNCWILYEDTYTPMSILLDDTYPQGRSQYYRTKFFPPDNCRPYKFICKRPDGSFVNLPEEDTYFFGTQMMEWEYTLDPIDGVDGVPGATVASLAGGYDCDEQHYYYDGTEWIVNGGPTLTDPSDIWYYHNGGTCRGCQYISILECWQECIENNFNPASCSCAGPYILPTNAPADSSSTPTTQEPTIVTLSPTDSTSAPSTSPTAVTMAPTSINPSNSPTMEPTFEPTSELTSEVPTTFTPTSLAPTTQHPTMTTTDEPSVRLTTTTAINTMSPTVQPTIEPTVTLSPTNVVVTNGPTIDDTDEPSIYPTFLDTLTSTIDIDTTTTGSLESTSAEFRTTIETSVFPTSEPSMEPTAFEMITSSTEIIEASMISSTEEGKECLGLDIAITFFYFFQYDEIQRKCDICLYEQKGRKQERTCEKIADFVEGIVDDFSKCMLNVCDYDCTVDKLQLNPTFIPGDESCGCNVFECGPQAAKAFKYNNTWMITWCVVSVIALFGRI